MSSSRRSKSATRRSRASRWLSWATRDSAATWTCRQCRSRRRGCAEDYSESQAGQPSPKNPRGSSATPGRCCTDCRMVVRFSCYQRPRTIGETFDSSRDRRCGYSDELTDIDPGASRVRASLTTGSSIAGPSTRSGTRGPVTPPPATDRRLCARCCLIPGRWDCDAWEGRGGCDCRGKAPATSI